MLNGVKKRFFVATAPRFTCHSLSDVLATLLATFIHKCNSHIPAQT